MHAAGGASGPQGTSGVLQGRWEGSVFLVLIVMYIRVFIFFYSPLLKGQRGTCYSRSSVKALKGDSLC